MKVKGIHKRKNINLWYGLGISFFIIFTIIFMIIANKENPLYEIALASFILFSLLQSLGWFFGLFKRKEANAFFISFKAIDIYTHILGGFSFCLIFQIILNFNYLLITLLITIMITSSLELFEFIMESTFKKINETSKSIRISYVSTISERLPNILQDLISNSIGALLGILIIIFIL